MAVFCKRRGLNESLVQTLMPTHIYMSIHEAARTSSVIFLCVNSFLFCSVVSVVSLWTTIKSALQLFVEKKHLQYLLRGTWGGGGVQAECNLPSSAGPISHKGSAGRRCCLLPTTLSHVLYGCSRPRADDET